MASINENNDEVDRVVVPVAIARQLSIKDADEEQIFNVVQDALLRLVQKDIEACIEQGIGRDVLLDIMTSHLNLVGGYEPFVPAPTPTPTPIVAPLEVRPLGQWIDFDSIGKNKSGLPRMSMKTKVFIVAAWKAHGGIAAPDHVEFLQKCGLNVEGMQLMITNVAAANAAKRERLVNRQAANVAEAVALAEMASAMQLVDTD